MPYVQLIIATAFTILGQLLAPKEKGKTLDQIAFPTATEDRPKPMWVGTVKHTAPNCIWYGDYAVEGIKNDINYIGIGAAISAAIASAAANPFANPVAIIALGAGLSIVSGFFGRQIIAHHYMVGFQLNFGWGQLDEVSKIMIVSPDGTEVTAWSGSMASGTISINEPKLFGGDGSQGSGGFQSKITLYSGDGAQTADPYVVAQSGATPAYKNDILMVFEGLDPEIPGGAYVGNAPAVPQISIVARRCPNQLGVTGGKHIINGADANPVCALYEFMTREANEFGGGFSPGQFNIANWKAAAETLYAEGLGISRMFDSSSSAGDVGTVINEYEQFMDAVVNINLSTGLFELKLVRNDYDVGTIPTLGDDDIIEMLSYKRGSWSETYNEVKLTYIDRDENFNEVAIAAQDGASSAGQTEVRSQTVSFPGISNSENAHFILGRALKLVSTPLTTISLRINRTKYDLQSGSVFKYTGTRQGIAQMVFRIASIDSGTLTSNTMELKAVQDIFTLGSTVYVGNESGWQPPVTTATNIVTERAVEQPYLFSMSDDTRIMTMAKPVGNAQFGYALYTHEGSDSYVKRTGNELFTPTGTLTVDYASDAYVDGLKVTSDYGMHRLPNDITDPRRGLLFINDEILSYESYTVASGVYTFNGVWGGLLDTLPTPHSAGDRVWFVADDAGLDQTVYASGATVKVKLASVGSDGEYPLASCAEMTV